MSSDLLRQMYSERLDEARQRRDAYRARALHRARRREARAERLVSRARQARVEAAVMRRQLEADL